MTLALRALLNVEGGDWTAERIAAHVIERALAGHFGYFRLLLDMVDGKPHHSVGNESTGDAGAKLFASEDTLDAVWSSLVRVAA